MKRVVVITGVAGGIGSATAKLFHENKWLVFGVDFEKPEECTYIDHFIPGDLSKDKDIKNIFDAVKETESYITALVNNAAIQVCKPLIDISLEEWDRVIRINLTSAYLMMRHAFCLMKDKGGAIVNISSVHAISTSMNISAYAASKGALLSLTRATSIEFSSDNIRVNAILPGAVDTPMLRKGLERCMYKDNCNQLDELRKRIPMKRIGHPKEIAEAILFLSDEKRSSYITGQILVVDGGATARLSTE